MHSQPTKERSCLLICSSKTMRKLLAGVLKQVGTGVVHEVETYDHAVLQLRYTTLDLVVWAGSDDTYRALLQYLRRELHGTAKMVPFLLCVPHNPGSDLLRAARDAGASGFLTLPLTLGNTLKRVSAALGDTRKFIDTNNFVGPDRRRDTSTNHAGLLRRATDKPLPGRFGAESVAQADGPGFTEAAGSRSERSVAPLGPSFGQASSPVDPGAATALDDRLQPGQQPQDATGPVARSMFFRRRAQVAHEAVRLVNELNAQLAGSAADQTDGEKGRFNDLFNRLLNLMVLIYGYCREDSPDTPFFDNKYKQIMGAISRFSQNILSDGLDHISRQAQQMIDGTSPASVGSAFKIYDKMMQFEALIKILGGYDGLPGDLLDQIRRVWKSLLALAELDTGLDDWNGGNDMRLQQVASERIAQAENLLKDRVGADSQSAALQRVSRTSLAKSDQDVASQTRLHDQR